MVDKDKIFINQISRMIPGSDELYEGYDNPAQSDLDIVRCYFQDALKDSRTIDTISGIAASAAAQLHIYADEIGYCDEVDAADEFINTCKKTCKVKDFRLHEILTEYLSLIKNNKPNHNYFEEVVSPVLAKEKGKYELKWFIDKSLFVDLLNIMDQMEQLKNRDDDSLYDNNAYLADDGDLIYEILTLWDGTSFIKN